jgi:alkanesulfonate monooxygenase SsuD/methylene tetrahydromethanopterin reductase-like flavin-dependent oxidoreductase (luciferase family)
MAMRFGAAFWIHRTGWPEVRDAVLHAEAAGFDDLWLDDHLLTDEGRWRDGKLEGWSTLAAIATITTRARIGLLVAANTFRNPGLTAKLATTLDHQSGGRVILGLGGGWFEREHDAFGIDFGSGFGERLDRLGEAVPLVRRLLDGERVTHVGRWYRMHDAVCEPRPVQPRLPLLIGGSGPRKTLPLVARHADIWNAYGSPESLAAANAILRDACAAAGRDQREIERTTNLNVVLRHDRAEAEVAWPTWRDPHRLRVERDALDVGGSAADAAAALDRYRTAGFEHVMFVFRSPFDLETIDRLPELRAALGG